jgi:hypothetical protein
LIRLGVATITVGGPDHHDFAISGCTDAGPKLVALGLAINGLSELRPVAPHQSEYTNLACGGRHSTVIVFSTDCNRGAVTAEAHAASKLVTSSSSVDGTAKLGPISRISGCDVLWELKYTHVACIGTEGADIAVRGAHGHNKAAVADANAASRLIATDRAINVGAKQI